MSFPGNDLGNQGRLISSASLEAIDAQKTRPVEPDRRFRDAGWWPSNGTVLRVLLLILVIIVVIGWALTLLK